MTFMFQNNTGRRFFTFFLQVLPYWGPSRLSLIFTVHPKTVRNLTPHPFNRAHPVSITRETVLQCVVPEYLYYIDALKHRSKLSKLDTRFPCNIIAYYEQNICVPGGKIFILFIHFIDNFVFKNV